MFINLTFYRSFVFAFLSSKFLCSSQGMVGVWKTALRILILVLVGTLLRLCVNQAGRWFFFLMILTDVLFQTWCYLGTTFIH